MEEIVEFDLEKDAPKPSKTFLLSTISSASINHWLIENYLQNIDTTLSFDSFLYQESYRIDSFLKKERQLQLDELVSMNRKLEERNLSFPLRMVQSDPKLRQKKPKSADQEEGFAKFALYLILGGGVCIIYSVLAPERTGKQGPNRSKKIVLARRKKWLLAILNKGWIDRKTYRILLKKIESLPQWLGGITPTVQSEMDDLVEEPSVDLSRRKSGESVVKTKDTSLESTSR